jgi:protein-S-isoprenylcysteine O-methyltransferase Ste14
MNSPAHISGECGRLLPSRALLISILGQAPLLVSSWPCSPSVLTWALGMTLLTAGILVNVWSVRLFRASEVGIRPFSAVARVVSSGPYRFSRNPMYLGLVFISAAMALITGQLWNLWAAGLLSLYLHFRFVLPEEQFLQQLLGHPYLEYAVSTPRWLGLPGTRARSELTTAERG